MSLDDQLAQASAQRRQRLLRIVGLLVGLVVVALVLYWISAQFAARGDSLVENLAEPPLSVESIHKPGEVAVPEPEPEPESEPVPEPMVDPAQQDKIAALLETARVGGVENNLEKQQQAYQQLVALEPRPEWQQQLNELNQAIQARDFATVVQRAVNALEQQDYQQAQQLLEQAARIDSTRAELAVLQARAQEGIKAQQQQQALQQLAVFIAADEWPTVQLLVKKEVQAHPENREIQQIAQRAQAVTQANARLDEYLNRPDRLSDPRILTNAISAIAASQDALPHSAKLAAKIERLETLIEAENQPLPVLIKSDNRTYIRVLQVGQVGNVTERTIHLKPGTYQIEGRREGYQTVLQTIVVSKSALPVVVQIQCTTRI